MEHADVIVIGLGAMGSAATCRLALQGARVLGIDRFDPPHARGSSHGDTRITRHGNVEGAHYTPLVIRSHEIWRELEERTGEQLMTVTGGLVIGHASATATGRAGIVDAFVGAARSHGVAHEILTADEISARFPAFQLHGDETGYYEPAAGYLRPEACIRVQLEVAARSGARLRRNERVTGIEERATGVTVTTDRGRYGADRVIVSTGSWIGELVPEEVRAHLAVYRQVLHWFDTDGDIAAFAQPRFPVFIWQMGVDVHQMFYGFPAVDGPGGGVKLATEQYTTRTEPDALDRTVSAAEVTAMAGLTAQRLRGVGSRVLRSAVCAYTIADDWDYVIGTVPGAARTIMVSACVGRGFKHSAAIGEALAELATTGRTGIDITAFAPERLIGGG